MAWYDSDMGRRITFEEGEWYHCFNRGVDKRPIFANEHDANRFMQLLYLANSDRPVDLYNIRHPAFSRVAEIERGETLADIGCYCLMRNHYHLLIRERSEGGLSRFMQKVGTAYTMYFNAKYERDGHLFGGPFRAKHVGSDRYVQRVLHYIHANPAEIYEPEWKSGIVTNVIKLERNLIDYPFSSLRAFEDGRNYDPILSEVIFDVARPVGARKMIDEATQYYREIAESQFGR